VLYPYPDQGVFDFEKQLMLVTLRGSYDYSLYGLVYGMLNRQEVALQVALRQQRGFGLYGLLVNWIYAVC
jgi:hypothetical protein